MLTWDQIKSVCLNNLDQPIIYHQHKINARCPFCGDSKKSLKKKRLWVTFREDEGVCIFHCFNCEESGTFYKLYAFIKGVTEKEAIDHFESVDAAISRVKDSLISNKSLITLEQNESRNFNWIRDYCVDVDDTGYYATAALKRLEEFRKDRLIPEWVDLFIAYKEPYAGRVIIPVYNEAGDIIYFQGRSLAKNPTIKYRNPVADKILKQDLSKHKTPLIITEGLINAFMLPEHGVASLGSFISDDFLEYLYEKFQDVIIALDNDKAGYKSLLRLLTESKYGHRLRYFLMPKEYKDINDLNELKMKHKNINIIDFVISNSGSYLSTCIILKMDKWRSPYEIN